MDLLTELGRRLRLLRERRNWEIERLSQECGILSDELRSIESGTTSPDVCQIAALAEAFDVRPGVFLDEPHALESEMRCTSDDILEAVRKGHRAKVDVRGKLAEYFLWQWMSQMARESTDFALVCWNDKDGQPDFDVTWKGKPLRIECKNVRSPARDADLRAEKPIKVELQKTRNSRDGKRTRWYRFNEFDVIAACLFNRTLDWSFAFCATRLLRARADEPGALETMQDVPNPATSPWSADIRKALDDAISIP